MVDPSPPVGASLWRLPIRALLAVLVVEVVAVASVLLSISAPAPGEITLAAFLVLLSLVHTELATGIERIRRRAAESSYFDLSSVWTFAAAVLLPTTLSAGVIAAIYLHLWCRVWRPAKVPLHRHVYTTATVVLAAIAAHTAVEWSGGMPAGADDAVGVLGIGLAVVLYVAVNTLLVGGAIALSDYRVGARDLAGRWDDNALEVATICMGALAAVALGSSPGLVALILPPILVLHRAVLVRQLEEVANTDGKTGLLSAAAWHAQAVRTVRRVHACGGSAGVLILDLDHFKAVNDAYGHLVGDEVLAAVAAQLRAGVRRHDLVGRFGGEEFVVLLPDLPPGTAGHAELTAVAERLRRRIFDLDVPVTTSGLTRAVTGLSISVGGAAVPADGTGLDQVMRVADESLYAAKRGGRNAVRVAAVTPIPAGRLPTP